MGCHINQGVKWPMFFPCGYHSSTMVWNILDLDLTSTFSKHQTFGGYLTMILIMITLIIDDKSDFNHQRKYALPLISYQTGYLSFVLI